MGSNLSLPLHDHEELNTLYNRDAAKLRRELHQPFVCGSKARDFERDLLVWKDRLFSRANMQCAENSKLKKTLEDNEKTTKELRAVIAKLELIHKAKLFNQTSMARNDLILPSVPALSSTDQNQFVTPEALFIAIISGFGLLLMILIIIGVIWCVQRSKKSDTVLLAKDDLNVMKPQKTSDPKLQPMNQWKSITMTKKRDSDEDLFNVLSVDEGTRTESIKAYS